MDAYLEDVMDRGQALWVAALTDGRLVYQDDGRPDTDGPAWLRLSTLLREESLGIRSLRLRFRTEWWCGLPEGAPAYYFSKGIGGVVGGPTQPFYAVGYEVDGHLRVARVAVPDLAVLGWEDRPLPVGDLRLLPGVI